MFTAQDVQAIETFEVGDEVTSEKLNNVLTSIETVINTGGSASVSTLSAQDWATRPLGTIGFDNDNMLSKSFLHYNGTKMPRRINSIDVLEDYTYFSQDGVQDGVQNGVLVYVVSSKSLYIYTSVPVASVAPGWHKIN